MRIILASMFVVGLCSATAMRAKADDTYTFKSYKSKKGDKSQHESSEATKTIVTLDIDGTKSKQNSTNGRKEVYTEEILEMKEGGRATKLTRTYTIAEKTEKEETTNAVYAGKTLLIEQRGDKYEFSIDGRILDEDEAPDLFKKYNTNKEDEPQTKDFLPDGPTKVGGTWKVPDNKSEKMFKLLSQDKIKVDLKKSTIEGKFLKAYQKDGAQFGVVELLITVFISEVDTGDQFIATTEDSKLRIKATMDICIDGSVERELVKLDMSAEITAEIPDAGSVKIQGSTTITIASNALKK